MADDNRDDEVERARALILKRRSRLMAAAMTGISVIGASCSKSGPSVCLSFEDPDGEEQMHDAGAGPSVCLGALPSDGGFPDAMPTVCLEPLPPDEDAGPTVCLGALPDDAGAEDAGVDGGDGGIFDAGPTVCLDIAIDGDELDELDQPVET
jgi:hypothetical protein